MNKAILIGNLTKDPELRATQNGITVCTFTIAVNRRRTNQQGAKETDYFTIIAWRALGDNCAKYLAKGRKVAVTGEIQTRTYDAKDGTKRYVTEIIADNVEFLTARTEESRSSASTAYSKQTDTEAPPQSSYNDEFEDCYDPELPF